METTRGGLTGVLLDGRYRMGSLIARGGMSAVYRAVDTRLDRPVAVKVMSQHYSTDQAFLARFEREARLAAGVGHPGVVAVYDYGRDGDNTFLVMELVDGGTLRDLLRERGALPAPLALSVLEPLLAALGAAHAAGLVHRDIKPENVLISGKGEVKVADFGLVRAVSSQTMATGDVILGTVAYLAPEQVATGAADPRSDVYAAGVVAYEMLTGAPPYSGDSAISVAYQHVNSDVPPASERVDGLPTSLDELIVNATRRDPQRRPRDAGAFLSAVVAVRARLGLGRIPVPVPARPAAGAKPRAADETMVGAAGPTGTQVVGVGTAGPDRDLGPAGTRVVGPGGPATVGAGNGRGPTGTQVVNVEKAAEAPAPAKPHRTRTLAEEARRRKRIRWIIVILVTALLGTAAAVGGWWLGSGRWAYTPTTLGLTRAAAEQTILDAGLVPQVQDQVHNDAKQGTVADATPAAGSRVLRGTTVQVVVSLGKPQVPTIEPGTSVQQAEALIVTAKLRPVHKESADAFHQSAPVGSVIGTDPGPGQRLSINSDVILVRSKGPRPVPVPEVAGKTQEDATNKLVVDGFVLGPPVLKFDGQNPAGTVLGTEPEAGEELAPGQSVSLVLADSISVPFVRNDTYDQAITKLTAARLEVIEGESQFDQDIPGGSVIRTEPDAFSLVDPANPGIVVIRSTAVTVPDFTNRSVRDAQALADQHGLRVDVESWFTDEDSLVYDQDPAAGALVEPGAEIDLSAFR